MNKEYTRLPDEFNRDYKYIPEPERKKKNILQMLVSFVAITTLIFPLTINACRHHHSEIDRPPVIDEPPVVEEYDILGMWESGGDYYKFFEDGFGYWTDGNFFIGLTWEKSGNDYKIEGYGITEVSKDIMSHNYINITSQYHNGDLYLTGIVNGQGTAAVFKPSEKTFNEEVFVPLLKTPLKDKIEGFWEHMMHYRGEEDGIYNCLSYIEIMGDSARFDFAGTETGDYSHYETGYRFDEEYPNMIVHVGEDVKMTISIKLTPNSTHDYECTGMELYYYVTETGDGFIADALSQRTLLEKYDWENPD